MSNAAPKLARRRAGATLGDLLGAKLRAVPVAVPAPAPPPKPAPPPAPKPAADDDVDVVVLPPLDPRDVRLTGGVAERRSDGRWAPWPVLLLDGAGRREAAREVAEARAMMPLPAPPLPPPPISQARALLIARGLIKPAPAERPQAPWGRRATTISDSD